MKRFHNMPHSGMGMKPSCTGNLPHHLGIIMDGNGRWAKRKGLPRGEGHERGIQRAKEVINAVRTFGIKALTLYAFSSENWQRPPAEVDLLMEFLEIFLLTEMSEFKKQDIAFQAIGDLGKLPESVRRMVVCAEKLTAACKEMVLTIAISYGGRNEIVRATRKVLAAGIKPDKINEDVFSGFLDTAGLPEPDFIIRTSGEKRISNFLIWQLAYSQFYFTNTLWPDFGTEQLIEALRCYGAQEDMEKTIEN